MKETHRESGVVISARLDGVGVKESGDRGDPLFARGVRSRSLAAGEVPLSVAPVRDIIDRRMPRAGTSRGASATEVAPRRPASRREF